MASARGRSTARQSTKSWMSRRASVVNGSSRSIWIRGGRKWSARSTPKRRLPPSASRSLRRPPEAARDAGAMRQRRPERSPFRPGSRGRPPGRGPRAPRERSRHRSTAWGHRPGKATGRVGPKVPPGAFLAAGTDGVGCVGPLGLRFGPAGPVDSVCPTQSVSRRRSRTNGHRKDHQDHGRRRLMPILGTPWKAQQVTTAAPSRASQPT